MIHPEFKTGFIRVRADKGPDVPAGENWNNYLFDRQQAEKVLKTTGRIGKVAGYDGIAVIDHDTKESYDCARRILPPALTEKTTSDGYHQFIRLTAPYPNRCINRNKKEHLCEIRTNRQYVVIAPSHCINKTGKWGSYELINDLPIPDITPKQLDDFITELTPDIVASASSTTQTITQPIPEDLTDLLKRDTKLRELYNGGGFSNDRSSGDMSLAIKLFMYGFSRGQVYDLMTSSNREKWRLRDGKDDKYRDITLSNAERQAQYYTAARDTDRVINLGGA